MVSAIQTRSRKQIRESIGYALGEMMLVTSSSTVDKNSLIAAYSLRKGGEDEYKGRQVVCVTPTGSIVAGEKSWVSAFATATWDATVAPDFSANITSGDIFEMWRVLTYEEVNEAIDQAFMEVTDECLQVKEIHNLWTESSKYEYDCLSSFKAVHKVEYVSSIGTETTLDNCDSVWTAGSANVTVTADATFEKEGTACVKAVEDGNSGTNAILAYHAISSTDIDDCDKLEFWMYSSIALTAGQLKIKLDDTAAIASAVESIDIPAMSAATWYRHSVSLANPHLDVDLISVGIFQVADVGTFTFYVDDIRAVKEGTKEWKSLNAEHWGIVRGSTNYLKLTSGGLATTGTLTQLRVNGFKIPALLTADTGESEIDPNFIIAFCVGQLLSNHAKSGQLDVEDRQGKSDRWLARAERIKRSIQFRAPANFRSI